MRSLAAALATVIVLLVSSSGTLLAQGPDQTEKPCVYCIDALSLCSYRAPDNPGPGHTGCSDAGPNGKDCDETGEACNITALYHAPGSRDVEVDGTLVRALPAYPGVDYAGECHGAAYLIADEEGRGKVLYARKV